MMRKPISPLIAGLLIAGVIILFAVLSVVTGSSTTGGLGFLQYLLVIIALIFLISMYAKAHNNTKTFGELFGYGFKTTTIYTLVFLVFLGIYLASTPEIKEKSLEAAREEMEKQGRKESEIEQGMAIADKFFWIAVIGGTMFFLVLVGTVGSLIGAAIPKKNAIQPIDQPGT